MALEILAVILGLVIYILLTLLPNPFGKLFSLLYLFIFFLFTRVHISETQGGFYTALILGIFIFDLIGFGLGEVDKFTVKGYTFRGIGFALLSFAIGFLLFMFMRFLGGTTPAAVIGVPVALQISAGAASALSAAGIGLLGIIENRFFIGVIKALKKLFTIAPIPFLKAIPFLMIALPFILGAALFAIFHGTIIVGGAGFLIFAFLMFLIWGILAFTPLGELAGEIAHYLWNVVLTLSRFAVVG